jgi:hypothetical protein
MWSKYADCHRGLCLQFETCADFGVPYNVTYTDDPVILNFPPDHTTPARGIALMLTKTATWAEEEEWRIVDTANEPGLRPFRPAQLSGLIFGAHMPIAERHAVRTWLRIGPCRPKLLEARLDPTDGKIRIASCSLGVG